MKTVCRAPVQRIWPGDDAWAGSAIVMWSGLDLKPRNLFDRTPFYPYPPTPPAPLVRARGAGAGEEEGGRAGGTAAESAPRSTPPDQRK